MLVRHNYGFDRFRRHAGHGESPLQNARREPGVDEYSRPRRLNEDGVPTAPTSEDPQLHQVLQRLLCASASCLRPLSPSSTCRRAITRSATRRNLATSYVSYGSLVPHANGGITFGGVFAPKMFAPVPMTVPVLSIVPIPVL